ncbi:MAG: alpha/beta hydrolase, partial [Flavobacteriaceae bacterium]|nr:alpha/beta hydrolase [Flavobacteriaceae bacterium]
LLEFSEDKYEVFKLEWIPPKPDESIESYARRMSKKVTRPAPVLIGVSFGGILVQEMQPFVQAKKIIIISSIKHENEMPFRMRLTRITGLYKLVPKKLSVDLDKLAKYVFGKKIKKRLNLYKKHLYLCDDYYLKWSIETIIHWKQKRNFDNLIHIHGEKDEVFPSNKISNFVPVSNGTHIMIINRYKWFNAHLEKYIQS